MKNLDGRTLFSTTLTSGNIMNKESYKDYFEEIVYDDENLLLKFKEEFENDFWDNGKPIKYHMFLNLVGYEDVGYSIQLLMLPAINFISDSIINELADLYDVPRECITERDIMEDKIVPILANEALDISIEGTWYTDEVIEILETATAVIPFTNNLIGFNLDRCINRIGTTNWDCLEGLLEGFDPINKTIRNFKEAK